MKWQLLCWRNIPLHHSCSRLCARESLQWMFLFSVWYTKENAQNTQVQLGELDIILWLFCSKIQDQQWQKGIKGKKTALLLRCLRTFRNTPPCQMCCSIPKMSALCQSRSQQNSYISEAATDYKDVQTLNVNSRTIWSLWQGLIYEAVQNQSESMDSWTWKLEKEMEMLIFMRTYKMLKLGFYLQYWLLAFFPI